MTTELATRSSLPGRLREDGYDLPPGLPFDRWLEIGETLQQMERSVQWWPDQIERYGKIVGRKSPRRAGNTRGRHQGVSLMHLDPTTLSPLSTAVSWWPRFVAKIAVVDAGCWSWRAYVDRDGYGRFAVTTSAPDYAHRVAYRALIGPIPDGLTLDHLCHTNDTTCPGGKCSHRRCVNPWHCEPVTSVSNVMRGRGLFAREARATECVNGHPFTPDNIYAWRGHRYCRACRRAVQRGLRGARRAYREAR